MTTDTQNSTHSTASRRTDRLWAGIIASLVVVGVLMSVGFWLLTGSWGSLSLGVQVLLVAVIVAAIRSVRH